MDTTRLQLPALEIYTPNSAITANVAFDFRSFTEGKGGDCHADLRASIGRDDLAALARGYLDDAYLQAMPREPLTLHAQVDGNIDHRKSKELVARVPGVVKLTAQGNTHFVMQNHRTGDFKLELNTRNLQAIRQMLPKSVLQTVNVPDGIDARGTVGFTGNQYRANFCC